MKNTTILLSSLLLLDNSLSPSFKESYGIIIPANISLCENGSFEIGLSQNNISDKDTIVIDIDDSFVLSDSHGKDNVSGTISNKQITFTNEDTNTKTVNYSIENPGAGDWHGSLNINISVMTQSEANTFADGTSVRTLLAKIKPTKITFSHDEVVDGDYFADLSKEQDDSIKMYYSGTEVTITNMCNQKFKANEDMSNFFKGLSKLTTIENIDYIDMSTCTNMSNMFFNCSKLTSIDISSFDVSNVTDMSAAFRSMIACTSLGDISDWDVSNVETFEYAFSGDLKLSGYGDFGKWDVSNKCTNISNMFANMSYTVGTENSSFFPSSLNLTNWDVSNVTNMSQTFYNTFNLQTIDISTWNCSNVINMDGMFKAYDNKNVSKLSSIVGIDKLNVAGASKVDMFLNCNQLSKPTWYQ